MNVNMNVISASVIIHVWTSIEDMQVAHTHVDAHLQELKAYIIQG